MALATMAGAAKKSSYISCWCFEAKYACSSAAAAEAVPTTAATVSNLKSKQTWCSLSPLLEQSERAASDLKGNHDAELGSVRLLVSCFAHETVSTDKLCKGGVPTSATVLCWSSSAWKGSSMSSNRMIERTWPGFGHQAGPAASQGGAEAILPGCVSSCRKGGGSCSRRACRTIEATVRVCLSRAQIAGWLNEERAECGGNCLEANLVDDRQCRGSKTSEMCMIYTLKLTHCQSWL